MSDTTINLDELQTRSIEVRAADSEKREITGIAMPYGEEIDYWGYRESFEPGAIDAAGAILRYGHEEPIGRITSTRETETAFEITAKISNTPRGDEVWTLVKDGVLTSMSIGFEGKRWEEHQDDNGITHVKWTEAKVREVSIVEFPAYTQAKITNHRSKPEMSDTKNTIADMNVLNDRFDQLERQIAVINEQNTTATPEVSYRSYGEYISAYKNNEDAARNLVREAYKSDNAIALPQWVGVLEKRMEAKQPLANLFNRVALPSTGMTLEYAKKTSEGTIKVDKQTAEGAALAAGAPGAWEIVSAKVETYGGQVAQVTRQAIERTTAPAILEEIFTDLAFQYAAAIERSVEAEYKARQLDAEKKPVTTLANLDALDADALLKVLLELSDAYEETPFPFEGVIVSPAVFDKLIKMPYDRRALQIVGAPADHIGTFTVAQPGGAAVGNMWTIQRVKHLTGNVLTGYSKDAITLAEQPGAPLRLQQENISNLTQDFAVYGYAATYSAHPELIKAVKFGA